MGPALHSFFYNQILLLSVGFVTLHVHTYVFVTLMFRKKILVCIIKYFQQMNMHSLGTFLSRVVALSFSLLFYIFRSNTQYSWRVIVEFEDFLNFFCKIGYLTMPTVVQESWNPDLHFDRRRISNLIKVLIWLNIWVWGTNLENGEIGVKNSFKILKVDFSEVLKIF